MLTARLRKISGFFAFFLAIVLAIEIHAAPLYQHPVPCFFVGGFVPLATVGAVVVTKTNNFGENTRNDFGTLSVAFMGAFVFGLILTDYCNDLLWEREPPPVHVTYQEESLLQESLVRFPSIRFNLFSYRF